MAEIVLTIPHVRPVSVNRTQRQHHMAYTSMKNRYLNQAGLILNAQWNSRNLTPLNPPIEIEITYCFPEKRGRDGDNYSSGSTKWLIDFMKMRFFACDDSAEYVRLKINIEVGQQMNTIIKLKGE